VAEADPGGIVGGGRRARTVADGTITSPYWPKKDDGLSYSKTPLLEIIKVGSAAPQDHRPHG